MAIAKEKFIRGFLDELSENLQAAETCVLELKDDAGNTDSLKTILRSLHTIKGSARMLQFETIEKFAHGLESVFKGIKDERYTLSAPIIQFVFKAFDLMRGTFSEIEATGKDEIAETALALELVDKITAVEPFDLSALLASSAGPADSELAAQIVPEQTAVEQTDAVPAAGQASTGQSAAPSTAAKTAVSEQQKNVDRRRSEGGIRIASERIDQAIQSINTLSIKQLRLWKANEDLKNFEQMLKQSLPIHDTATAEVFRQFKYMKTRYEEYLNEIDSNTTELRDILIEMRMLPLEGILEKIPRMVTESAMALSKNIQVKISNSGVMLDRAVLEKIQDPIIHLVRNSVDHGIESPEERKAAGKSEQALISIDCKTEGSRATVLIRDDGRGFDYAKIRARAEKMFPDTLEDIANMSDAELLNFIFLPGFSTKEQVTSLSGRGVGLDIVKVNIDSIKGKIVTESQPGLGTSFSLQLPVSIATLDGMFVDCAGKKYFVPSSYISETVLVSRSECFTLMNREMYALHGQNIPLYELAAALRLEQKEKRPKKDHVLIVQNADDTVGVIVDRILEYKTLVFRSLPAGLAKHPVVQGIVFDENYNIIPILNIAGLLNQIRKQKNIDSWKRFVQTEKKEKRILVVDDSRNTREIETAMLELEGYSVTPAEDGLDALEKLGRSRFDLILSDINMPRMDGFTLLENIKRDEEFSKIPIVLISTADDPINRARAQALGVDGFIRKASFDQDNLLEAVARLIGRVEK